MKTLIELYDERPVENVLSTEIFAPEDTVFLCEQSVAENTHLQSRLRQYFESRGVPARLHFIGISVTDTDSVAQTLLRVIRDYPDCAMDIAGGTDAALFAGGMVAGHCDIPVFTYSRRQNRYFNIRGAAFAHEKACTLQLSVADCFLMAGGSMRTGRVDNSILDRYLPVTDDFFGLYLKYRPEWVHITGYITALSQPGHNADISLSVGGSKVIRGAHGTRLSANMPALRDMEKLGLINALTETEDQVSFTFADAQIRTWLRDVGSVLEIYVYKMCLDAGIFGSVCTSAVVDWAGSRVRDGVTNEIDVVAVHGIRPLFISCKTCDVKTEALNELAVLRDRFGSGIARAAIVTTGGKGKNVMRNRASELDITVIELEHIKNGRAKEILRNLALQSR